MVNDSQILQACQYIQPLVLLNSAVSLPYTICKWWGYLYLYKILFKTSKQANKQDTDRFGPQAVVYWTVIPKVCSLSGEFVRNVSSSLWGYRGQASIVCTFSSHCVEADSGVLECFSPSSYMGCWVPAAVTNFYVEVNPTVFMEP